jgi:PGF-pre-PGF domain-containing protein
MKIFNFFIILVICLPFAFGLDQAKLVPGIQYTCVYKTLADQYNVEPIELNVIFNRSFLYTCPPEIILPFEMKGSVNGTCAYKTRENDYHINAEIFIKLEEMVLNKQNQSFMEEPLTHCLDSIALIFNRVRARIESIPEIWASVEPGSILQYQVEKKDIPILKISFEVEELPENISFHDIGIDVIKYENIPAEISNAPASFVYAYLSIEKNNLPLIDYANITFMVPIEWINNNSIDENSVILYRYANDHWNPLQTQRISSSNQEVIYSGITYGLSYYAIGATNMSIIANTNASNQTFTYQLGKIIIEGDQDRVWFYVSILVLILGLLVITLVVIVGIYQKKILKEQKIV